MGTGDPRPGRDAQRADQPHVSHPPASPWTPSPARPERLIRKHREARQLTPEQVAEKTGLSADDYKGIESGSSEIEEMGPFFLRFAEVIEQPVFNLFHPFGLPFEKLTLDDYK